MRFAFDLANPEGVGFHPVMGMPGDHAAEVEGFRTGAGNGAILDHGARLTVDDGLPGDALC